MQYQNVLLNDDLFLDKRVAKWQPHQPVVDIGSLQNRDHHFLQVQSQLNSHYTQLYPDKLNVRHAKPDH